MVLSIHRLHREHNTKSSRQVSNTRRRYFYYILCDFKQLKILPTAIREFTSKEDLLRQFGKNNTAAIAAINFIGNDSIRLNYEIGMYDKYFTWNTDKLFMPMIIEDDPSMSYYVIILLYK
jgi:hypothetical protein